MYLFCNLRIHVITLYSGHVCVYYASMLRCWHLVWILIRTDHPCLGVGCHNRATRSLSSLASQQTYRPGDHLRACARACKCHMDHKFIG
jgi:hypothetical protein